MKKLYISCAALGLMSSSGIAGETADSNYLSSEETFLQAHPDAIEIRPSVFQLVVDEFRTRTYAFGIDGMQYQLERTHELLVISEQKPNSSSQAELEEAYRSLSEALANERHDTSAQLNSAASGNICWGHVWYELEAVAGPVGLYNAYGSAYAEIAPDIGFGPHPGQIGPFQLYAFAHAEHEDSSATDGGWFFTPDVPDSHSAMAMTGNWGLSCLSSTATASVYAYNCGSSNFRSITEDFSFPAGCNP